MCLLRAGEPRLRSSNTQHNVTSTASCAPPPETRQVLGKNFDLPCVLGAHLAFMSLRNTSFRTVAPASRKMRATVCSVGVARFFMLPLHGHDARWCPHESSWAWQPSHRASVICSGNDIRSRSSVLNMCGGIVNSGLVVQCPNVTPAFRPECE